MTKSGGFRDRLVRFVIACQQRDKLRNFRDIIPEYYVKTTCRAIFYTPAPIIRFHQYL